MIIKKVLVANQVHGYGLLCISTFGSHFCTLFFLSVTEVDKEMWEFHSFFFTFLLLPSAHMYCSSDAAAPEWSPSGEGLHTSAEGGEEEGSSAMSLNTPESPW